MTKPNDELNNEDELREMFERFQGPDSPSPSLRRKRRRGLSLALAFVLLVGASVISAVIAGNRHESSHSANSRKTSGMCAARLIYDKRSYDGNKLGPDDSFGRGDALGSGIRPGCRDTIAISISADGSTTTEDSDIPVDETVQVFSVFGIDPADAVMIEGEADILYISASLSEQLRNSECRDSHNVTSALRCVGLIS